MAEARDALLKVLYGRTLADIRDDNVNRESSIVNRESSIVNEGRES